MSKDNIPQEKKVTKKKIKQDIIARLESSFGDLKLNLGDKKFARNIKAASKALLEGMVKNEESGVKKKVSSEKSGKKTSGSKKITSTLAKASAPKKNKLVASGKQSSKVVPGEKVPASETENEMAATGKSEKPLKLKKTLKKA